MVLVTIFAFLFFVIGIVPTGIYLIKLKGYNYYNFMIFVILTIIWITVNLYNDQIPYYKDALGNWLMPSLFFLFYFTQVASRLPFAVISRKLNSRTIILKIVLIIFALTVLMVFFVNQSWTIWIACIAAGLIASTFGLQNQYHAENFDLKKIFRSVAIVYATPILGSFLGIGISELLKVYSIDYRWTWLFSFFISLIPLIWLFFIKERRETITADKNVPAIFNYDFKKKELIILVSNIFFISFALTQVLNTDIHTYFKKTDNHEIIFMAGKLILLVFTIFITLLVIKKKGIMFTKIMGYTFSYIGILTLGTLLIFDLKIEAMYIASYSLFSIGYSILFTVLFGAALHADHKKPMLVSAIFLTINSLSIGLSIFVSKAILINVPSMKIAIIWITSISFGMLIFATSFSLIFNKKIGYIYIQPQKYEFSE